MQCSVEWQRLSPVDNQLTCNSNFDLISNDTHQFHPFRSHRTTINHSKTILYSNFRRKKTIFCVCCQFFPSRRSNMTQSKINKRSIEHLSCMIWMLFQFGAIHPTMTTHAMPESASAGRHCLNYLLLFFFSFNGGPLTRINDRMDRIFIDFHQKFKFSGDESTFYPKIDHIPIKRASRKHGHTWSVQELKFSKEKKKH